MSNRNIDIFIKICNEKGLAYGFKEMITSNVITDMNLYKKFYNIYFQLNTKRKKHDNFLEELKDCLDDIGLAFIGEDPISMSIKKVSEE